MEKIGSSYNNALRQLISLRKTIYILDNYCLKDCRNKKKIMTNKLKNKLSLHKCMGIRIHLDNFNLLIK